MYTDRERERDDIMLYYIMLYYLIWGCFGLFLQAWKGRNYFTELAERVEYGKYVGMLFMFYSSYVCLFLCCLLLFAAMYYSGGLNDNIMVIIIA